MLEPGDERAALALVEAAAELPPAGRAAFLEGRGSPPVIARALELAAALDELPEEPELGLGIRIEAEPPDRSGERVGGYRLLRPIGEGATGRVYLAAPEKGAGASIPSRVALKVLKHATVEPRALAQLARERAVLARLAHPNIARLLDGGATEAGHPFVVTEWIDGRPLDVFARGLELDRRLRLFVSVCAAVIHAHRQRVIHRDLKPSNVLVTAEGQPKLLDFGIAKHLEAGADPHTVGMLHTPAYASPEQLRGEPLDAASDVYALGVVLYELVTGELPFRPGSGSPVRFAQRVGAEAPAPPSARAPSSPELDRIVLSALGKTPAERAPSAAALADELRALLLRGPRLG